MDITSYTEKIVMHSLHTLVQGLKGAAVAGDVMESFICHQQQQPNPPQPPENQKNLINAKESTKRGMDDLTRTQEEPHGTTSKLSDYHKGKIM